MHGYALIKTLRSELGNIVSASPGNVYPALKSLTNDGFLEAYTDDSERRIYKLTDLGIRMARSKLSFIESLIKNRDSSELINILKVAHQILIDLVKNWSSFSEEKRSQIIKEIYILRRMVSGESL